MLGLKFELDNVVIGADEPTKDIYLHFKDVEDQVCTIWRAADLMGWHLVGQVLMAIDDLLMLALDDHRHGLIEDLRFLQGIACHRKWMLQESLRGVLNARIVPQGEGVA